MILHNYSRIYAKTQSETEHRSVSEIVNDFALDC
jgi:hypothetical protein